MKLVTTAEEAVAAAMKAMEGVNQSSSDIAKRIKRLVEMRSKILDEKETLIYSLYCIDCLTGKRTPLKLGVFYHKPVLTSYGRSRSARELLPWPEYWRACEELSGKIERWLQNLESVSESDRSHVPQLVDTLAKLLEKASELAALTSTHT